MFDLTYIDEIVASHSEEPNLAIAQTKHLEYAGV